MNHSTSLRKAWQLTMISAFILGTAVKGYSVDSCGGETSKGNLNRCCFRTDKNGKTYSDGGNCTWWVAKQAMDNWKISASDAYHGNANNWDNELSRNPLFSVSSTPQANSIGVKDISISTLGKKYGHVVWITKVVGNNVSYSQMNCGLDYGVSTGKKDASKFDRYIIYVGIVLKDFWRKEDPIYSGVTKGFDAQFKLTQSSGKDITLEFVTLSLHDANGKFVKDIKSFDNVKIVNGKTWQTGVVYTDTTDSKGIALPAGTYRVVAKIDENFNGKWDGRNLSEQAFNVLASSKPNAPTGLSVSASGTSIALRWKDVSANESGFNVYRWYSRYYDSSNIWVLQRSISENSTSFVNSGLAADTPYTYKVCAYNANGESCSADAKATTASSGILWNGKSPSGTPCEKDATTVASQSNEYGEVQLLKSLTCNTYWTKVIPKSSSYSTDGEVRRTTFGSSLQTNYTASGKGKIFTKMIYDIASYPCSKYAPPVQTCASGSINGHSLNKACHVCANGQYGDESCLVCTNAPYGGESCLLCTEKAYQYGVCN